MNTFGSLGLFQNDFHLNSFLGLCYVSTLTLRFFLSFFPQIFDELLNLLITPKFCSIILVIMSHFINFPGRSWA
jgi:hypothetical protein